MGKTIHWRTSGKKQNLDQKLTKKLGKIKISVKNLQK